MADDPLRPVEVSVFRERSIEEGGAARFASDRPRVDAVQAEALFNRAAKVSNKSNILLKAIEKVARRYAIPVSEDASEVRAAVARRSADSPDGSLISFDLYRDAIEYTLRVNREMEPLILMGPLTETNATFAKKVRRLKMRSHLQSQGLDNRDDLLEMLVSQIIIVYIAHQLQKVFEGLEDHSSLSETLVPKEEGAPEAVIIINVLIGLAVQMAIMQINDQMAEKYLENIVRMPKGVTAKSLVADAKTWSKSPEVQLAGLYVSQSDYTVILHYARDFLVTTIEPGYEFWLAYLDVCNVRTSAQSMWAYAPHYSPQHAAAESKRSGGPGGNVNDSLNVNMLKGLFPMSQLSYLARSQVLDNHDATLDIIAQVLHSDFALSVACCLGAKLGKMNPKVLKFLKALLEGLLRAHAFDVRQSINAMFAALMSPNYEEVIAEEAMNQIDKVFYGIMKNLMGMFGDKWEIALCCPLLGEVMQAILASLARTESELKGATKIYLNKAIDKLGIGSKDTQIRYERTYENRTLRKIILIIDAVINAMERFDLCGQDWGGAPLPEPQRNAISLPTLRIDENEDKNYFTNAQGKNLSNGLFLPALGEDIWHTAQEHVIEAGERLHGKHVCGAPLDPQITQEAVDSMTPSAYTGPQPPTGTGR